MRGESPEWPFARDAVELARFEEFCTREGVSAQLHASASRLKWPERIADFIRRQTIARSMWEQQHATVLAGALEVLANEHLQPLVFKGTALAYSVYAEPYVRARADSDLLLEPGQRKKAAKALQAAGFVRQGSIDGEYVSYEVSFTREQNRFLHYLDLHWRIHYSQFQSIRFPYAYLRRRAGPLPRLSPIALAPAPVDSILLNCVHRANDMNTPQWASDQPVFGTERLISLYDIHLLLESMGPHELDELTSTAQLLGVMSICRRWILAAVSNFATRVPTAFIDVWKADAGTDAFCRYHAANTVAQRWADFASVPGVRCKVAYLAEHISPPADYMRERFPLSQDSSWSLRARRLAHGLKRWRKLY
jgi:hypothetical protein